MTEGKHIAPLLRFAQKLNASDIHLVAGVPPAFRVDGEIVLANAPPMTAKQTTMLTHELINDMQRKQLEKDLELCLSMQDTELGRFRITVYFHAGSPELAIRRLPWQIPTREELGLPVIVEDLARSGSGLVLVTGPTGMGKTTTLSFMIDLINSERRCKIVTIEDPIEYVHRPKKAIVVQQEVHVDTLSFSRALVHVLRQDANVICVGEMRDLETIATALTAAETGHLVLATLHTANAAQTVERIVDVFPAEQQNMIVLQLANCLQGVIAQLLLPRANKKGRVLATEILVANIPARSHIRDRQWHQLPNVMSMNRKLGMRTMDTCLRELYEKAEISYDMARAFTRDAASMRVGDKTPSQGD